MRIIIAGGRDFYNYILLKSSFLELLKSFDFQWSKSDIEIVSGTARGADQLGEKLAKDYNLSLKKFPANWDSFGKRAGYIRNEQMAIYAKEDNGYLLAFWDGKSRGTKHMIDLAKKHKIHVKVINY